MSNSAFICISFDDLDITQYDIAFPILKAAGMVATINIVTDNVGVGGRITLAQLLEMKAAGWEMASHTKTHASLTGLSLADLDTEMSVSKQWIIDNLGVTPKGIAYPGGAWNADVVNWARKYYEYGRAASLTYNYFPLCRSRNYQPASQTDRFYHLFNLCAATFPTTGTSLALVKSYIDSSVQYDNGIILLGHVIKTPAGTVTCTPEDFLEVIKYVASTRIRVVTLAEALRTQPQPQLSTANIVENPLFNQEYNHKNTGKFRRWNRDANCQGSTAADGVLSMICSAAWGAMNQQHLMVIPGVTYNYSVEMQKVTAASPYMYIRTDQEGSASNLVSVNTSNTAWTTKSGTFKVPSGIHSIKIALQGSAIGTCQYKNFSITPIL